MAHFEVLYGRPPPSLLSYIPGMTKVPKIENQLIQRDILLHVVRFQLSQAQAQMKMNYNELRLEYEFKEGDQVYI